MKSTRQSISAKKVLDEVSALERVAWENLIASQTTVKAAEKRTLELQTQFNTNL